MNTLNFNIESVVAVLQGKSETEVEAAVRILLVAMEELERI